MFRTTSHKQTALASLIFALAVAMATLSTGTFSAPSAKAAGFSCTLRDNFNRANGTNMGSNWTERVGDFSVVGNQAGGTNASLMTFNGGTSAQGVCADVVYGSVALQYVALVLDYAADNNNIFIKVQSNSSPSFDTIYFYIGNNGNGGACAGNTPLTASFTSARLFAHKSGLTAILDIDTDFDDTIDQTYQCTYGAPAGNGVGVGVFGPGRIDNFGYPTEVAPATPLQALAALKASVLGSGAQLNLPTKLATYLKSAESYLAIGSPTMNAAACQQLTLFKSAVTAAMRQDSIVLAQGATWIGQADAIRAAVPCAAKVVVVT